MARYAALFFLLFLVVAPPGRAEGRISALDRVMQTKTLRCGYIAYEPFVIKNPNTGALSGIAVDYVNELAARKGLSVDWAAETTVDQWAAALDAGRFDAICVPATPNDVFDKVLEFSSGLGGLPYYVYVPDGRKVSAEQLATARFAVVDGFALTAITQEKFPRADLLSLPQLTSASELYDQLRYGKADAHVNENVSAANYMRNNPGVIRKFSDDPLISMKMFLVSRKGDAQMRDFMVETFDVERGDHASLLESLKAAYNAPVDALISCRSVTATEKGWQICQ